MPTETDIPPTSPIGRDTPRVDGPLKVTGKAQYASDFHFPGQLYAVPVEATIASGRVARLDTAAAEKMPGVRAIFHRGNIGNISRSALGQGFEGIIDERRPPFEDDVVRYYGQYIALAVADTFESAKAAADAVSATYARDKFNVDPNLVADPEPDVVATTFAPAKRLQSERGNRRRRLRDGAGQARPDLRHAHRDAQPHRAAGDDRDLGRPDADASTRNRRASSTCGAFSRRCSACPRRTSGSSRGSSARVSAASSGPGRIARSPSPRRGSSTSRSSSSSAAG